MAVVIEGKYKHDQCTSFDLQGLAANIANTGTIFDLTSNTILA
jgi:hypothetical protein